MGKALTLGYERSPSGKVPHRINRDPDIVVTRHMKALIHSLGGLVAAGNIVPGQYSIFDD